MRMDWERLARTRGSRRWFFGVAGATAGAAGLAAAGCGGGSPKATPVPSATAGSSTTVPSPDAKRTPAGIQLGDTLRYTAYVASDLTYDPHKTQAGPFDGQQAMVYSRLLSYDSQTKGTIVPDLATSNPEQPDGTTLIFKLKPGAKWQDRAPLNGRAITADDVKYSIERQTGGDPSFVRKASLVNIDKVESRDASTVVITMKTQLAAMVDQFADVSSFIVAPEATADGRQFGLDNQPGSGPFRWVEWVEGKLGSVAKNPAWFGGSNRPYLDGVAAIQPTDARDLEAGLRTKKLDVAFVGRGTADRLKQVLPALQESTVGQLQFFGMRFFIPQVPYNDLRFRSAISIAVDRRDMVQRFFGGSGDINPWIAWPLTRWTLPQSELSTVPGYRPGSGGRDQDITDAKALLAAFAASNKIPDELPLFVVADAETNLQMGSVIRDQLQQTLGLNVTVYPVPTGELIRRLFAQDAPWAAGPDSSQIDLDDCVYPYFHSSGTQNTFPLRDSEMDALINAERSELDETKRREIGFNIQRRLLALNVGVNLVSERVVALAWPYVRNFPLDSTDGYQNRFADCWIDRTDPSYRGR